jgi:drug/metabolite transporter (DMT)-like permease
MGLRAIRSAALPARRRGQLFVALAAVAWSTAGLFQRELGVDTATQLAGRALFAFLFVAGVRSIGSAGFGVAVCTAVASGSFIVALNHAKVANVLFIQAVAPVVAAVLAWIAFRETVSRRAWLAMAVAIVGVALMVGGPGSGGVVGVGVSLLMSFAFAAAIVITRHRRDVSMVPAVGLSQLLVLLAASAFAAPATVTARDLLFLVLLGAGQMGLGLVFVMAGTRLIPAAEVALITLLEIVLAPLWVWISISERPAPTTLVGGAIVIGAVFLQATGRESAPEKAPAGAVPAGGVAGGVE